MRYLVVVVLLAAGLMSKNVVTVPLLLLLLDWWPLSARKFRRLALEKIPLLALSALACAATLGAARRRRGGKGLDQLPLGLRLPVPRFPIAYLAKTAWPVELSVLYPFPLEESRRGSWGGTGGLAVFSDRLRPAWEPSWLAAGWAWYVITLLPVIGIVQVGMQAMADRYLYVPMIRLLIAMAWECAERWGDRRALLVLAAVLLLALGYWHGARFTSGEMA